MIPEADRKRVESYVLAHLDGVLKEPRGFIRYPFIDPGSVYDGNVWDWDTYWSVYGLLSLADRMPPETLGRVLEHARGNVRNFLDHQMADGYIPMMIEVGKWPEPYLILERKKGVKMNMHKPFLCGQICLISRFDGDWSWAAGFEEGLRRYFDLYDREFFQERSGLYYWEDDIMIGMDNDPASFGRPKASTANIFLNSFMAEELRCMAEYLTALGKPEEAERWLGKREKLIGAIRAECWDPRDEFFYSVDIDVKTRPHDWIHQGLGAFWRTLPIRIRTWSGFIPMWAGFATEAEAEALTAEMFDPRSFDAPYGICTLAKNEKMFSLEATINPSNWLGPVWLVANYVAFRGLLNYGKRAEAEEICRRSLALLARDLEKIGCLHEYYNPFTGEPIMNGGFINWNILALTMARELEQDGENSR